MEETTTTIGTSLTEGIQHNAFPSEPCGAFGQMSRGQCTDLLELETLDDVTNIRVRPMDYHHHHRNIRRRRPGGGRLGDAGGGQPGWRAIVVEGGGERMRDRLAEVRRGRDGWVRLNGSEERMWEEASSRRSGVDARLEHHRQTGREGTWIGRKQHGEESGEESREEVVITERRGSDTAESSIRTNSTWSERAVSEQLLTEDRAVSSLGGGHTEFGRATYRDRWNGIGGGDNEHGSTRGSPSLQFITQDTTERESSTTASINRRPPSSNRTESEESLVVRDENKPRIDLVMSSLNTYADIPEMDSVRSHDTEKLLKQDEWLRGETPMTHLSYTTRDTANEGYDKTHKEQPKREDQYEDDSNQRNEHLMEPICPLCDADIPALQALAKQVGLTGPVTGQPLCEQTDQGQLKWLHCIMWSEDREDGTTVTTQGLMLWFRRPYRASAQPTGEGDGRGRRDGGDRGSVRGGEGKRGMEDSDGSKGEGLGEGLAGVGGGVEDYVVDTCGNDGIDNNGNPRLEFPNAIFNVKQTFVLQIDSCNWGSLQRVGSRITSGIRQLTQLRWLQIALTDFLWGPLPEELWSCVNLRGLVLRSTSFDMSLPESIGNLSELRHVELTENRRFHGTLPDALGSLVHLRSLMLSRLTGMGRTGKVEATWGLYGRLPPSLCRLRKLRNLYLDHTHVSGPLPDCMEGMSSLDNVRLRYNLLNGRLSESLWSLPQLRYLNVEGNHFEGPLPNLPVSVRALELSNNRFSGQLLPISVCSAKNLETLAANYNNLTGTLPRCIFSLRSLRRLELRSNHFHGTLPEWPDSAKEEQDEVLVVDDSNISIKMSAIGAVLQTNKHRGDGTTSNQHTESKASVSQPSHNSSSYASRDDATTIPESSSSSNFILTHPQTAPFSFPPSRQQYHAVIEALLSLENQSPMNETYHFPLPLEAFRDVEPIHGFPSYLNHVSASDYLLHLNQSLHDIAANTQRQQTGLKITQSNPDIKSPPNSSDVTASHTHSGSSSTTNITTTISQPRTQRRRRNRWCWAHTPHTPTPSLFSMGDGTWSLYGSRCWHVSRDSARRGDCS
eukprot:GHVQ01035395.1.p1 GENE.GHVQ01035395.1~~GHVQ01035395.1.p1  ORF type:complete len:1200 (-),score=226.88 GHVQ01035395.1:792-3992(-)